MNKKEANKIIPECVSNSGKNDLTEVSYALIHNADRVFLHVHVKDGTWVIYPSGESVRNVKLMSDDKMKFMFNIINGLNNKNSSLNSDLTLLPDLIKMLGTEDILATGNTNILETLYTMNGIHFMFGLYLENTEKIPDRYLYEVIVITSNRIPEISLIKNISRDILVYVRDVNLLPDIYACCGTNNPQARCDGIITRYPQLFKKHIY